MLLTYVRTSKYSLAASPDRFYIGTGKPSQKRSGLCPARCISIQCKLLNSYGPPHEKCGGNCLLIPTRICHTYAQRQVIFSFKLWLATRSCKVSADISRILVNAI